MTIVSAVRSGGRVWLSQLTAAMDLTFFVTAFITSLSPAEKLS